MDRKPYPSDVSDEEWELVAPYLTLMTEEAPQRVHDLLPWGAVHQQTQRWRWV
jgi:transposase